MTEGSLAPDTTKAPSTTTSAAGVADCRVDSAVGAADRSSLDELALQNRELLASLLAAERDLRRYLKFFENMPLAALALDCRGVVREANEAAAKLFGAVSSEFLAGRSLYRHLDQEAGGRLHGVLNAFPQPKPAEPMPAHGPTVLRRLVVRRQADEQQCYDAHVTHLPPESGEHDLALVLLVDQTPTDRLVRDGQILKDVSAATSSLIYAFDTSGNLIFANPATRKRLGGVKDVSIQHRPQFESVLGSWSDDVEVLVSGKPRTTTGTCFNAVAQVQRTAIEKFPILDDHGNAYAIGGITSDLPEIDQSTASDASLDQIAELSMRDPLTGLYNRSAFMEKLRNRIEFARESGAQIVVGFVDIDGFKDVNDSMGHNAGDGVLCAFARHLKASVGERGHVARYGGDEFILFLNDVSSDQADRILQTAFDDIRSTFEIDGTRILLTFSAGLSHFPHDAQTAEELLHTSDNALYSAKLGGRDKISKFSKELRVVSERRLLVLSALRQALAENHFRLEYQPKFELTGQRPIVGGEALLRWRDPKLGDVSPSEFVPLAEANGLFKALDLRVLKLFAEHQRGWLSKGRRIPISVNIAARSLQSTDFVPTVLSLLNLYDIPAELLSLEITETGLMNCPADAGQGLAVLSEAGVRISIDDFGTGYSSLAYLHQLTPSELKIDRSFIAKLDEPEGPSHTIVRAILALSESLGLQTVAEGIENEAQFAWLAENGCPLGQGFLVKPALPADQFLMLQSSG